MAKIQIKSTVNFFLKIIMLNLISAVTFKLAFPGYTQNKVNNPSF